MKIALLTLPLHANYGGVLQAFALKTVLERLGHEVWLVDNRRREKPVSNLFLKTVLRRAVESLFHRKEIFAELNTALTQDYKKSEIEKFIYRRLSPRTAPVYDADDYASIAADGGGYDLYIVGSDQVWRPRYAKELGPYFFSFLEGTAARRIAYAASFGAAECEYTREERERCGFLPLGEVAREADLITFHTPLDTTTRHLADAALLARTKPRAVIINSSRGEVVDGEALKASGREWVLDVWEHEPHIDRELLGKALLATPHIAGYSEQGKANATALSVAALARRFGLPLAGWYPPQAAASSPRPIAWQELCDTVGGIYDIGAESRRLKAHPEDFEALRDGYAYRHEYF